jgi:peptidoglycan/xylan/chitin deacetylase (PgdA/CDA1 family)
VALATALAAGDAALAGALGRSTAPLLRPADGEAGAEALRAAGPAGWRWAIAWDVDPGDGTAPGEGGPIAADIVTRVVARASGGSIVRLQLGGARTLEALPGILDGLATAGLRVVPLGDVLGLDDDAGD